MEVMELERTGSMLVLLGNSSVKTVTVKFYSSFIIVESCGEGFRLSPEVFLEFLAVLCSQKTIIPQEFQNFVQI